MSPAAAATSDAALASTLVVKFSKTSVYLPISWTESLDAFKRHTLLALAESGQPDDAFLGRPFAEAAPADVEVYRVLQAADEAEVTYQPLIESKTLPTSAYAPDKTPRLDALGLEDGQVLYLGFRHTDQGTRRANQIRSVLPMCSCLRTKRRWTSPRKNRPVYSLPTRCEPPLLLQP